jgi:hypothetical protein
MILWFNIQRNSILSNPVLIVAYLISREIFISLGIGAISFCLIVLGMRKRKTIDSKVKEEKTHQVDY